jgi:hypothetical protein
MWSFEYIRVLAIDALDSVTMDSLERADLAIRYNILEWLVPSLNALAQREKPLGQDDVNRLGLDTVLKMAEVREGLNRGETKCKFCFKPIQGIIAPHSRQSFDFTERIREVFRLK